MDIFINKWTNSMVTRTHTYTHTTKRMINKYSAQFFSSLRFYSNTTTTSSGDSERALDQIMFVLRTHRRVVNIFRVENEVSVWCLWAHTRQSVETQEWVLFVAWMRHDLVLSQWHLHIHIYIHIICMCLVPWVGHVKRKQMPTNNKQTFSYNFST